jgi:hypothetical protein
MTEWSEVNRAESIEGTRHDPLLRLDQFIHRQDEMIRLLKVQNEVAKAILFAFGVQIFVAIILLVYLIWK